MPGSDAAIASLAQRMIERSLPKAEWTHRGHWALALWLTRHRPDLAAGDHVRQLITRYNEATGTPNCDSEGYHHTITLASMRAAADLLRASAPDAPLAPVLDGLMASPLGKPEWLLRHWRRETLFSVKARRDWAEPDLAPLPF